MQYSASLRYLNSFLNLERIIASSKNRRWNLDRMRFLLTLFGHPEKAFYSVVIAGTKGKGSTGFFLESMLKESGLRTGFYSSPHLTDPRERIRLNGKIISKSIWTHGLGEIHSVLNPSKIPGSLGAFTYFEILTLLAVLVFRREKIRIGIFEVGMGGRLDATRLVNAELAVITPIALDHQAFLGNTVAKIAHEKAAVIGKGATVVMAPQPREALWEIKKRIQQQKARAVKFQPLGAEMSVGLLGDFQRINAAVALRAAQALKEKFQFRLTAKSILKGLQAKNWPGRMELVGRAPAVLIDGAHNPVSIEALVRNLKRVYSQKPRVVIFAVSRDKDSKQMLQILSRYFKSIVLTRFEGPRSQDLSLLSAQATPYFWQIFLSQNSLEALRLAKKLIPPRGLIVATGSFYLAGEISRFQKGRKNG
ncbi:MAG: bifunctional folylpolyglutamate synthase/dihydrofolate synthase [Candidatus Omnitrophica bacterium]|nr:bifunctional folylpolyglutamate synthase/dihydrofolate synthase [Candidatus Omnitrophota bacterium]